MTDAEIYDKYFIELQMVLRRYQMAAFGLEDAELLALRREENAALLDLLQQQRRALAYAAGEAVPPETQFAKAVIPAIGGPL